MDQQKLWFYCIAAVRDHFSKCRTRRVDSSFYWYSSAFCVYP